MEFAIFAAFLAIQFAAKLMPQYATRVAHWPLVAKVGQHHWIVWCVHPAVLHGIHDYAIHFVIYSGYVIRSH